MGRCLAFYPGFVVNTCIILTLCLSYAGAFVAPAPSARLLCKTREGASPYPVATLVTTALSSVDAMGVASCGGAETSKAAAEVLTLVAAAPSEVYLTTGLFGITAAALVLGAGALVLSTVNGKDGLGAFLSKEKGNNPFYQENMPKVTPRTPDVLNKIRLPELDFVEVYNQPPRLEEYDGDGGTGLDGREGSQDSSTVLATAESLRQRLLDAVQAKDYNLASSLERELANFLRQNGIDFEGDAK